MSLSSGLPSTKPAAVRHFLDLWRMEAADLRAILDDAKARKAARAGWPKGRVDADAPARDRVLAMIFEKHSTRTRFSFDAAMRQLGGDVIISTSADMQLGRGEPIEDTAKVLSRMVDAVMIRANTHEDLERLALAATVPVINGLTDRSHPCQILADLLTFEEHRGPVAGRTLAWVGDGNNVCASFIHAAGKFGFKLNIACPTVYHPDLTDLARAAERLRAFEPYQVDTALMDLAAKDGVFLHCLPAHRGEEVVDAVIDGPRSLVWEEAENRIHAQKSVLAWCFGAI